MAEELNLNPSISPTKLVQSPSRVRLFSTQWAAARQASLFFTISRSLLKLTCIELVTPSDHLIICHPLLLLSSIFPSIRVFANELVLPWGGQSIGVSASASVLPVNIQDWFPLGSTDLISLLSKGLSRVFSNTTVEKHQFFGAQLSSQSNSHIHSWPLEKPSVQLSHSVVSYSLRPHGLQHSRFPCPSPTPEACWNSRPSSQWCHPTISSSVIPFSSCLQSFPASGSFPMSQLFTSGGQKIGVSASTSVLSMNTQDWSPLGWTDWISLQFKGFSRVFSNTAVQKHQFFGTQLSL